MSCPRHVSDCCSVVKVIYLQYVNHMEDMTGEITSIRYISQAYGRIVVAQYRKMIGMWSWRKCGTVEKVVI